MLVQIGVFIMAVSFAIFAAALSKLLLRASTSIEAIQFAAGKMETKLDGTLQVLEGTLDEASGTISDMEVKLNALDSVFFSAEKLGDAANAMGKEMENLTKDYSNSVGTPGVKPFILMIQGAEFAKSLLKSWKRGQAFSSK
ncbi:DUF948 domain-containing protein [Sporosarcina koreensis]|uniref:DUF948 domain-containing protein n=1 Tax=Sporosarcina koreensis TaxID=334735 RepID=A0ABW0TXJ5_9BACL